jgi:thiosulfate/3-mercaptopyruvate sulfurtransferase
MLAFSFRPPYQREAYYCACRDAGGRRAQAPKTGLRYNGTMIALVDRLGFAAIVLLAATLAPVPASAQEPDPWKPSDLLQPADVAARLSSSGSAKPVLIEVSFPFLYRQRRIPGSTYAGPGSKPDGINKLRETVAKLPRNREIVLYCGCCPWNQCPNMRPAFRVLRDMGFRNVKAMYVPTNLVKDWIEKGYPIERSAAQ